MDEPIRIDTLTKRVLFALLMVAAVVSPVVALAGAGGSGIDKGGAGRGFVTGCVLDFSGDAGPITMGIGSYRNRADTATVNVASAVTLTSAFQAFNWATGGGIDTGAGDAASTWYAVHAVEHTDGTDAILLSLSASAPTAQTGQSSVRLLGWVRNDSGSNFLQSYQVGDGTTRQTLYRGEVIPITAPFSVLSAGSSLTHAYVDCAAVVPPTQVGVVLFAHQRETSINGTTVYNGVDEFTTSSGIVPGYDNANGRGRGNVDMLRLDADEDFAYIVTGQSAAYIDVIGWIGVFDGSE